MRVVREQQTLVLSVDLVESRILQAVLRALMEDYRQPPHELDAAARSVWYSTRGCESAKMSAEESAEWVAALHQGKGSLVEPLRRWVEQLGGSDANARRLRIDCNDAPAFMTAINDYRLLAAARHHIGQAEMDVDWSDPNAVLTPERHRALIEIDFLAWIIELILHGLAQSPNMTLGEV